jgi:hypothetical protein
LYPRADAPIRPDQVGPIAVWQEIVRSTTHRRVAVAPPGVGLATRLHAAAPRDDASGTTTGGVTPKVSTGTATATGGRKARGAPRPSADAEVHSPDPTVLNVDVDFPIEDGPACR